MKFVSYRTQTDSERIGLVVDNHIVDLAESARLTGQQLPSTMDQFLAGGPSAMESARKIEELFREERKGVFAPEGVTLLSPVPRPTSCRDGYAFRQHVATARRNRGLEMIPEFDQFPVFYFTNHLGVIGPGDVVVEQDHLQQLDFELECAIVIGRQGRNIPASRADSYIAGFVIMNDLSARVLQMDEMKLSLGPAKGKDFATALGPWLVTPDELESRRKAGENGSSWNLRMRAWHNGEQISDGNVQEMNWTFAEIIERASYGVDIYPGDVIGSGTVGTGCYLELNGTRTLLAKEKGTTYTPVWLKAGDTIELEIDLLGRLTNRIVATSQPYSILEKKKIVAPTP
jgi:fumarylacetoacetate (FAA) hydrolase